MIFRGEKSYSGKIIYKVGCVFPMVIVSILPHAEFGPNDHRENPPHFICVTLDSYFILEKQFFEKIVFFNLGINF